MKELPINVARISDEKRKITIQWEKKDSFIMHIENIDEMEEYCINFSFEGLVKTAKIMEYMIRDACLHDSESRMKLFKISKSKLETNRV
jgi:hypothetical protein